MSYTSKTVIFNLPLVSIGRSAFGVFAIGFNAMGVVAIGVNGVGVISLCLFGSIGLLLGTGMFTAGLFAIGQFALGIVLGIGQFTTGLISEGQFAVGYIGTAPIGYHAIRYDFLSELLFSRDWNWDRVLQILGIVLTIAGITVPVLLSLFFFGPLLFGFIRNFIEGNLIRAGILKMESAMATIESVEETGTYVNRLPVIRLHLQVTPQSSMPFHATLTTVAGYTNLSSLQPGATMQVLFNPKNPGRVRLP